MGNRRDAAQATEPTRPTLTQIAPATICMSRGERISERPKTTAETLDTREDRDRVTPPDRPGLGIDVDEAAIRRFGEAWQVVQQ